MPIAMRGNATVQSIRGNRDDSAPTGMPVSGNAKPARAPGACAAVCIGMRASDTGTVNGLQKLSNRSRHLRRMKLPSSGAYSGCIGVNMFYTSIMSGTFHSTSGLVGARTSGAEGQRRGALTRPRHHRRGGPPT